MPKKKKDITASQRTRRWHDGVAAINAATAASEIPDILAAHGKQLDLDMVRYDSLADTSLIDAAIFTGIGAQGYATRDALAAVAEPLIAQRALVESAMDVINAVDAATRFPVLFGEYGHLLATLGIDLTDFDRLLEGAPSEDNDPATGKWAVYEEVFDGLPYASEVELKAAFDDAVEDELEAQAVAVVNAAEDASAMSAALFAYADILEIDVGEDSDYAALEPAGQATVIGAVLSGRPGDPGYANAAAIKAAFDAAVEDELEDQAVAAVNSADAEGMGAVLIQYAAPLTLDLTDYLELDETGKGNVHTALVGKAFADAAAVKTAFDAAVAAQGEG
jgi:hypothetical protein